MLRFEEARQRVIDEAGRNKAPLPTQLLPVHDSLGSVIAQNVRSDREYPPFDRSTRDGYAVRAVESGAKRTLWCVGEIRAGDSVTEALRTGTCVQIMTGAAVPSGADAVVMIEFTSRTGEIVTFQKETNAGQNIVPKGSEAHTGDFVLRAGQRLGFAELAIAAQVGYTGPSMAARLMLGQADCTRPTCLRLTKPDFGSLTARTPKHTCVRSTPRARPG